MSARAANAGIVPELSTDDSTDGLSNVDSRSRLLTATLALIDEIGYDNVKVTDVAKRAGLTTGALYWNFSDRDELLAFALLSRMRVWAIDRNRVFEEFVSEALSTKSLTFLDLLAGQINETVRRDRIRVASASLKYPRVLAAAQEFTAEQRRDLEVSVRRLQDGGVLRADISAELISFAIHLFVTGMSFHGVAADDMPESAELVNLMIGFGRTFRNG